MAMTQFKVFFEPGNDFSGMTDGFSSPFSDRPLAIANSLKSSGVLPVFFRMVSK
jgi:hypothetical protein